MRLALRLMAIVAITVAHMARTVPAALATRIVRGRAPAGRRLYRGLVRCLQSLGPTFVKFGQISSTRVDALPTDLRLEMERLHDAVRPMSPRAAEQALRTARGIRPQLDDISVDLTPIGSGSIACVYRGTLPGGGAVALKLKRPGIDGRMRSDLGLLQAMVRAAQRLPKLRGMPMADLVGYVSAAILGQLDFEREARHIALIGAALEDLPAVRVPALRAPLCTPDCLVFEYLPDLRIDTPATLPSPVRAELAGVALAAVHKLFFERGLVHCDLHPGNLYLTPRREVVILDAGYCVALPDRVRSLIGEFFSRMASGDGRRCGEIVLESAVYAGPAVDGESFVSDVAELVARTAGPGNDFDMSTFGDAIYDLQQRHGIYAASDFAFPLMSLLVVEGTVRRLWPAADFQAVGLAGAPA
ncbi:MAG TPA: AarF/UbiB family protein [Solirubrobacteraceae bacterium]|jgi:ubiquinone biosynthesis protein|nr:AarF/UbiB family protein [Solirubrobacteraceae bacterium]